MRSESRKRRHSQLLQLIETNPLLTDEDVAAIVNCIEKGVREVVGTLIVEFGSVGKAPLVEKVTLDEMAERYRKEGI